MVADRGVEWECLKGGGGDKKMEGLNTWNCLRLEQGLFWWSE